MPHSARPSSILSAPRLFGLSVVLMSAMALGSPNPAMARIDRGGEAVAAPETPMPAGRYWWGLEDVSGVDPRGVRIVVSLPAQTLAVYAQDRLVAVSSVSTGKPGRDTPTGAFKILEKAVEHHSSLYDDAPMPYMERITWDGVAIHAGFVPGRPASHGCIRVPLAFARKLYDITRTGADVVVTDDDLDVDPLTYAAMDTEHGAPGAAQ